jgi:hypothetical protein
VSNTEFATYQVVGLEKANHELCHHADDATLKVFATYQVVGLEASMFNVSLGDDDENELEDGITAGKLWGAVHTPHPFFSILP